MLDKTRVDKELARRICAAFVSHQMGVSIAAQYKKMPDDVGDLWYFLAALADKLAREGQDARYADFGFDAVLEIYTVLRTALPNLE